MIEVEPNPCEGESSYKAASSLTTAFYITRRVLFETSRKIKCKLLMKVCNSENQNG